MVEIYNIEQRSNAWYDLKTGRISGSRFASLMAAKSTAAYQGLVNTIAGEILSGVIEDSYTSYDMERGIDLEPEAVSFYEEYTGVTVDKIGFVINPDLYPEYVGVSLDGIIEPGILEIKCPKMKTHIGYLRAKKLPSQYLYQVQGQLLVTKAPYCNFMSYYPGIKPFILKVIPDLEIHNKMRIRLKETINEIEKIIKEI